MYSSIFIPYFLLAVSARTVIKKVIRFPHTQVDKFELAPFDSGVFGAYPNQTYTTEPQLISPQLNILQSDDKCNDGLLTMLSLRGDNVMIEGQSPMIFDQRGNLVWMNATYGETFGLKVQKYKDQDYLTFWKGDDSVGGHGEGIYFMLDSNYKEAYRLTAGNGRLGDLHEFRITPEGTALLTQYRYEESSFGGGHGGHGSQNRQGYLWDSVFQEIDIETNKVLFEWHAADHFDINESDFPSGNMGRNQHSGYDFFHINSVDKDFLGNYLISSRYYQCLIYIKGVSGEILWTLGGKKNSFRDLSGGMATKFGWQHDARWNREHTGITLFDNGARYGLRSKAEYSRGIHINLNLLNMTAKIGTEYINPRKIVSASQGSMQTLPSGNVLIGYGYNAAWTEFTANGEVLCDVHVGSQKFFNTGAVQTYHVSKHVWVGRPSAMPEIAWKSRGRTLFISWNGATEIKSWVLQSSHNAGFEHTSILDISIIEKTGFETKTRVDCTKWLYVRAVAVDAKGGRLGISEVLEIGCEGEELEGWRVWVADTWVWFCFRMVGLMMGGFVVMMCWRTLARASRRRSYSAISQKLWEE